MEVKGKYGADMASAANFQIIVTTNIHHWWLFYKIIVLILSCCLVNKKYNLPGILQISFKSVHIYFR
jgi:hypothetical protein